MFNLINPAILSIVDKNSRITNRAKSKLGMNIAPVEDYGSQFAFKDMIKQGRSWTSQISGTDGGTLTLDAYGYPTSLALNQTARMYWITAIPNSGVSYTATHDGIGTFNRTFQDSTQMFWDLTATTQGNNLRNLKMLIPGTSDDGLHPFYQPFLDSLKGYGCLRFMDWGQTISNPAVSWSDRTIPQWYTYAGGEGTGGVLPSGAPYEAMIDLCNTVGTDMWVCVPHAADDTFITNLATLIKGRLKTNLKCYYELSNEVWNGVGTQKAYFQAIGVADNLDADSFQAAMKAYSRRAVQMFDLVDAIYGSDATHRRRRVMGSQIGNTGIPVLSFQNAYLKTDYYAVAPYLEVAANITGFTDDQVITALSQPGDGYQSNVTSVIASKTYANSLGVALCFYEFGPGASIPVSTQRAANFEQLMLTYLDQVWIQAGGGCPANYYFSCRPSSTGNAWGAIESLTQQSTAKSRALRAYIDGYRPEPLPIAPSVATRVAYDAIQNIPFSLSPTISNSSLMGQLFSMIGTLPTGLSLSRTTATISGTPTTIQSISNLQIQDGYISQDGYSGTILSNTFQINVSAQVTKPIDGYRAWYDPSDSSTITLVSSAVSQMTDKSGNNFTMTQATAGSRPTITTINGKNALSFAQFASQSLATTGTVSTMLSASAYTVFAVINATTITSNAATANNAAWGDVNGVTGLYLKSGGPLALAYNNANQVSTSITVGTPYVIVIQHGGGNISIETDTNTFTSTASGNVSPTGGAMQLGRGFGAAPYFIGALGEVLMYNTALTTADVNSNIIYLKQKWGIT